MHRGHVKSQEWMRYLGARVRSTWFLEGGNGNRAQVAGLVSDN